MVQLRQDMREALHPRTSKPTWYVDASSLEGSTAASVGIATLDPYKVAWRRDGHGNDIAKTWQYQATRGTRK